MAQPKFYSHGLGVHTSGYDTLRSHSAPATPISSWARGTGQVLNPFPIQVRYPSDVPNPTPTPPPGGQGLPPTNSKTSSEPQSRAEEQLSGDPAIKLDKLLNEKRLRTATLLKTGHELVDLSNKLISGPAVPELSKQKANPGQEDTGQAKAGEHKTKALEERDSDSPLLQELRAMRRRMDSTMELQRISGEKAISELRLELQSQIDDGEVKRLQSTIDYEKELTELRLLVSSLQCSVKDLTNYQITTDPVHIVRIQIRALVDKIHAFLYEAITGNEVNDRHRNVKSWWANHLNPKSEASATQPKPYKAMSKDEVDEYRYLFCLELIRTNHLESKPEYKHLIDSDTLKYLCKTTIELRQQANEHAHEIKLDMHDFREVLHMTKSTCDDLCSASEFVCLNAIVDFLETGQASE